MPVSNPSPPPDASSSVRGLVNTIAQSFQGIKTFLSTLIVSAGIQVGLLFNTNGTLSTDTVVRVGTSQADGSVNAAAKLLSIRTGLGGTEVEKAYFTKDGSLVAPYLYVPNASSGGVFWGNCRITGQNASGALELNYNAGATQIALNTSNGQINQRGVVSAVVGADTQNFPKGINTLASGATSATVTNSLVTVNSWVDVTFHADPGGRVWVTRAAGAFTVNVSTAPGANAAFSWEVCTLL